MRRRTWLLLAALPALTALGIAAFVVSGVRRSLDRARADVASEGRFPAELRTLGTLPNPGFETIASPASYRSAALYQGKLYVGGSAGLFVYGAGFGAGDTLLQSYRVGVDLPAAPLGAMAVGRLRGDATPSLMIATAGEGVLLFSEEAAGNGIFRQLWAKDAEARDVTALLPLASGELLIGTRKRGLLVYRGAGAKGAMLESFHPQLAGLSVTALAADETGFWVGTQNTGVRHWHGGEIDTFTHGAGDSGAVAGDLPDDQVDAIAEYGGNVFVGTPLGVEEFDNGRPARVLARNLFAHALYADDAGVTIGSLEQGVQRVSLQGGRRPGAANLRSDFTMQGDAAPSEAMQFLPDRSEVSGRVLYAVMRDGLRRESSDGSWSPMAANLDAHDNKLTDGNISALAFGPDGRLWVGYFDRGLDVVNIDGHASAAAEHHENDRLFCINRIVLDLRRNTMAVATANGLVLFDTQGKPRQVLTHKDGLIADHVTDVAFTQDSMILATPAGVTFVDAAGVASLYGFEGLVNNHVYALGVAPHGDEFLAGTLGGISVFRRQSIERNLTATNSGLKHNWVTAIVPLSDTDAKQEWMVGTYGAGVMRLGADGLFTTMDGASAQMVVNPNAMLSTDAHIFAGTLGSGLWVWSRSTGRWRQVTAGLPSENITALAEHGGEVYVGTDNGLVRIAERLLD
jgi:ligand-binding sensor domain-containing protein